MTPEQKEAVRQRLEEIEKANGGILRPDDVVADAKSKSSPLHAFFEWDVRKAAAKHWIEQARELITSIRVVVTTENKRINSVYYVRDPSQPSHLQGYTNIHRLRSSSDAAREAIIEEFRAAGDRLRRARELAVVLGAEAEVERLIQGVVGLRQRFESGDSARPS